MDHSFAPAPPEMQPHRVPGPGASFSCSHMLGRHSHPSKIPGGVSPLIPVVKKTVHLDTFSQSHVQQTSGRPGLKAKARSMSPQDSAIAPGAALSTLPANSLVPRKLSSISLTIRQNIQAQTLDPSLSHWEHLPILAREAATHRGGRLSSTGSPPMTLVPEDKAHSEGPGNPGLIKPSRTPTVEKPLVSSHLALPFQSRLTQNSNLVGPHPMGQGHTRASPGRGKARSRGIPRPQRVTPVVNLAATGTTKPDIDRRLATMATNRPGLSKTSRLDTGTELPAVDARLVTATDLSIAGPAKSGMAMDLVTTDPDKLGKVTVIAGSAKLDMTTGDTAMALAIPDSVKLGTNRLDTAIASARANNTAKLGAAMDSSALDTSRLGIAMNPVLLVTSDLPTVETKLVSVNNMTISDVATYPLMSRGTDPTQDHATLAATTVKVTEPATQDLARESKGFPETRTDAAMSELVPEPRPKPAVPMKPVSINSNLLGYIGIDTIIEQMRKKTMKTGFDFNIMVVGQSGLGKSTLVNTLFKSQVSRKASSWNREEKIPKTVEIKAIGHVIEEGGVKMKLTVIDTPGFGDQINNENCWEPIEKYINEQYEKFLKEEVNIARKKRIPDTRVHCCLYFISPTGHSLRPLDLEFMKHLSKVVNIIPVIAKADTMTLEEKSEFKQRVRKELEVNGIEFYPQKEFDEDLEDKTENDKIRESMPFAVVGSDKEYQVNGKRVLGRKTPWGIIEVENLNHCEFALLRDFVIRTHLQDLKEVTHNIHYETYRAKRLNDNGGLPPGEGLLGTVLPPVPATPCPTAE
ncbi:neuronal-specific septin-3 isoform X2 [Castor canadensis]|uniref:Neuronal-specific septin-3 isoform X2 n=1 Tax=Castor canadensis TaxID=51338 RepID=A0AC58NG86_CASCN